MMRAIRLFNPEMLPCIRVGEVALFDSNETPTENDRVIVWFADGTIAGRVLVSMDAATLVLRTYRPAADIAVAKHDVLRIHPISQLCPARDWAWLTDQQSNETRAA